MNARSKKYRRHIAIAFCKECNDIIISKGGGIFVSCSCGKSFIDQERFDAQYVRAGGQAEIIEQICPKYCKVHNKKPNGKIKNTEGAQDSEEI